MSHSPDDDAQSVGSKASTSSTTNQKHDCPHCNGSLQMRVMFNHIRIKHPLQFDEMIDMNWMKNPKPELPIALFWTVTDDFEDKFNITIYGCLSTGKTFQKIEKGIQHFKKNKTAHADHIKQFKEMNAVYLQNMKLKAKEEGKSPYKKALADKNPYLSRCMYSRILFLAPKIKLVYDKMKTFYREESVPFFESSKHVIEEVEESEKLLEKYLQEKELNPVKLEKLLYSFGNIESCGYALKILPGNSCPYSYKNHDDGDSFYWIGHPLYPQVHF